MNYKWFSTSSIVRLKQKFFNKEMKENPQTTVENKEDPIKKQFNGDTRMKADIKTNDLLLPLLSLLLLPWLLMVLYYYYCCCCRRDYLLKQ